MMCRDKQSRKTQIHSIRFADLALAVVIEFDAGPGGDVGVRVAAEFGLQGSPGGAVSQPFEVIQGRFSPLVS